MSINSEEIYFINLKNIISFKNHPFQVREDEQMNMLTESVRSLGVLVPAIVRPLEGGKYELISGHRRKYASELIGLSEKRVNKVNDYSRYLSNKFPCLTPGKNVSVSVRQETVD